MVSISSFITVFPLLAVFAISPRIGLQTQQLSEMTEDLVKYLIESNVKNFYFGDHTMFLITDNSFEASYMIDIIAHRMQVPVVILRKGFSVLNLQEVRPCFTFIIVKRKEDVYDHIRELLSSDSFKVGSPAALIICKKIQRKEEEEIADLLQRIWKFGLRRFVVFYTSNKFHVKKYNPFLEKIFEVPPIGSDIFDDQFSNLYGYKFRVSLFEEWPLIKKEVNPLTHKQRWVGRDIILLDIVMRVLNATYEVVEPPENSTYNGAVQDLLDDKVDFCFVRHYYVLGFDGIEYSDFNYVSELSLIVPSPRKLTRTEAIFSLMCVKFWVLIFVSFLSLGVFMRIFVHFELRYHWTLPEIFLDIWGMFIGNSIHRFHSYRNILRISVLSWLCGVLVLNVIFQSHLINILQFVPHQKGIQSIADLDTSDIPVYCHEVFNSLTRNLFDGQIRNIKTPDIPRLLWNERPNAAFLIPFAKIRGYVNAEIFPRTGSSSYDVLSETVGQSFSVYFFKKNSPFTMRISLKILDLRQYGLSSKISDHDRIYNHDDKEQKKLSLTQVEAAFYILIYGLILCFIVLFWEIILYSPHLH